MKKVLLPLLLVSSLAQSSWAESHQRKMSLTASPLSLPFGQLDMLYQLNLWDFLSLTFPIRYAHNWALAPLVSLLDDRLETAKNKVLPVDVSAGFGARFLLANMGLADSFYLEPRLQVGYNRLILDLEGKGDRGFSLMTLTPTARLGWDWYYASGFTLSVGAALGYEIFLKSDINMPPFLVNNFFAQFILPSENSSGRIAWDFEFKIGYAW